MPGSKDLRQCIERLECSGNIMNKLLEANDVEISLLQKPENIVALRKIKFPAWTIVVKIKDPYIVAQYFKVIPRLWQWFVEGIEADKILHMLKTQQQSEQRKQKPPPFAKDPQ